MSIFAVTYEYVDDEPRLASLRPTRFAFFAELERSGQLLASGQLVGESMPQGLLLLRADSMADAGRLLDGDPFATAGVITTRRIGRWHPTVGLLSETM